MSALLLSSQTSSSFEPVANLVGGRNVSVEPRFPGTPGGTLQPSRMAQLLPVEYPYGGAVGSEDWEPNSPSGALDPCAMSRFGDMTLVLRPPSTANSSSGVRIRKVGQCGQSPT